MFKKIKSLLTKKSENTYYRDIRDLLFSDDFDCSDYQSFYENNAFVKSVLDKLIVPCQNLQHDTYINNELIEKTIPGLNKLKINVFNDLLIHGECFVYAITDSKTGTGQNILELVSLPARQVNIINKQYSLNNQELDNKNILHIKMNSSQTSERGISNLKACIDIIKTIKYATKWNRELVRNNAKPSMALLAQQTLTDEQFNNLQEMANSLKGKVGSIPVLEGGIALQEYGFKPVDLDYLNSLKFNRELIAQVYNVPIPLISADNSSYNNIRQARLDIYTDAILPLANNFYSQLSEFLGSRFNSLKGISIRVNEDSIIALNQLRQEKYDYMIKAVAGKILSINEARVELGFDPIEGELYDLPDVLGGMGNMGMGFDAGAMA